MRFIYNLEAGTRHSKKYPAYRPATAQTHFQPERFTVQQSMSDVNEGQCVGIPGSRLKIFFPERRNAECMPLLL